MKSKYLSAFVDMTKRFAQTSEAKRLKVGACLIKNGNPIAFGVNGTLPGWHTNECEDEHGHTHDAVLHAEINCLNKLRKMAVSSEGCTLIVSFSPCFRCSMEIYDAGITKVLYMEEYRDTMPLQWLKDRGVIIQRVDEGGVVYER